MTSCSHLNQEADMNKYSGIDLHSNNCVVAVIDDTDRVCCERRVPNDLAQIVALLAPHREELVGVVVESTYNWYWLVDGLEQAGYQVKLANTTAIEQYDGLKYSGDEYDARHLAHLLRLGILRTGYIYPKEMRAVRDLARKRSQLVRTRTMHILAVENLVARQTGGRISSNVVKQLTVEAVDEWGWVPDAALAAQANVLVMSAVNDVIAQIEQRLRERVRLRPEFVVLKTAPGIGDVLATTIMLETGTIGRFAQVGSFASYARCVDSARYSNGKKKGEGNRKNGNRYLAWAFVEAAHFALRYNAAAKRFYERKKAKTNAIVATKALAHKLARACYFMLKEQCAFDEKRCFT
jgi:transposase